ncbi:MAG: FAD-dependent oxidoreductase [Polyangiaceae bacterium]|nr:FAD-dependent oxidoreductase [Polyangiaceae bacterium]
MADPSVLVLGAGLAGLSTAIHLLEASGGRLDVTLIDRGHVVGGKASSVAHRDPTLGRTFTVDHGFHVFFDYPNFGARLEALGASAGLTRRHHDVLIWSAGAMRRFRALPLPSPLHLLAGGLESRLFGLRDGLAVFRFMFRIFLIDLGRLTEAERHVLDAVSFDDYARSNGLSDAILRSSFFRFVAQSAFIYPHSMSALSAIAAIQLVAQSYDAVAVRYMEEGTSDALIEPLRRHFLRLGGKLEKFKRATQIEVVGGRVDAVLVAENRHYIHSGEVASGVKSNYYSVETPMPGPPAPVRRQADHYVSTLPPRDLIPVLDPATAALPYFDAIKRLQTQRTIALELWYDRVVSPPDADGAIVGLDGPFSTVCDLRRVQRVAEGHGSVVQFVGEDGAYATRPDSELLADALATLHAIWPLSRSGVVEKQYFHRGAHDDFFLTTPGSDALRPAAQSPFPNLVLAGDFTQTGFRVICMEGAWISGMRAANAVLARQGLPQVPIAPMRGPGGLTGVARALRRLAADLGFG